MSDINHNLRSAFEKPDRKAVIGSIRHEMELSNLAVTRGAFGYLSQVVESTDIKIVIEANNSINAQLASLALREQPAVPADSNVVDFEAARLARDSRKIIEDTAVSTEGYKTDEPAA